MVVRHPAHSAKGPAALLRPLLPSCNLSVLHKNTRMCTKQRSAHHSLPVPSLEKKRSLLPPVRLFPSTPPAFHNVLQPFLLYCCVYFAEREVEAAKKSKLLIFPVMQIVCIGIGKETRIWHFFRWPLNHVFLYIERCLWHHLYLSLAVGWKSSLIFVGWFMGP